MASKTEQCLLRLEIKLKHIHKDVEENSKDIKELQEKENDNMDRTAKKSKRKKG